MSPPVSDISLSVTDSTAEPSRLVLKVYFLLFLDVSASDSDLSLSVTDSTAETFTPGNRTG